MKQVLGMNDKAKDDARGRGVAAENAPEDKKKWLKNMSCTKECLMKEIIKKTVKENYEIKEEDTVDAKLSSTEPS